MYNSKLPKELIQKFDLDLSGLNVYTEAASGAYLLTPVIAALAGADHVFSQTRDSRFASAEEVKEETLQAAKFFGVQDKIEVLTHRSHNRLAESDIITNSGFVRPIDKDLISALKPTAVVPLMWETWEFRSFDFDLDYCKEKEILVLGTKEQEPPCDMVPFTKLLGLKLLFDLGYDGGRVLVLGNAPIPGGVIVNGMRSVDIEVTWFSQEPEGDFRYEALSGHFEKEGDTYDILILSEHQHCFPLLGTDGFLDFERMKQINPDIRIGIISGNINEDELKASGIHYFPEEIAPVGMMSYQPYMMGPRPVLTLYTAGLKVGEVMARARLNGLSTKDAAREALKTSPAMDFQEGLSWL